MATTCSEPAAADSKLSKIMVKDLVDPKVDDYLLGRIAHGITFHKQMQQEARERPFLEHFRFKSAT